MAINSYNMVCDKNPTKSLCSAQSSKDSNSCRLQKINMATDSSLSSTTSKSSKVKKNMSRSPYYAGDRVQLLSRVTEKRLVHKKTTDFVSSFPLAANIYKANSDEFKSSKKANKKVKKSVLTLPNDPAPVPQICTVSDMNDSEYCDQTENDRKQKVIKKRIPIQNKRKARVREKDLEFYDKDGQNSSQLNLDSSSTDIMKNFKGDCKKIAKKKKVALPFHKTQTVNANLNDVWAVLRNMNRLQFRPTGSISDESNIIPIKKKIKKRRTNRKDTRVFETCRTEEFAYIQSYDIDDKTQRSYSPPSSIDRITVIDKKNDFSKICKEFEKRLLKLKDSKDANTNRTIKNKLRCRSPKRKPSGNVINKENKQIVPLKKKKKIHIKLNDHQAKIDQKQNMTHADGLRPTNDNNFDTNKSITFPTIDSFSYSDHSGSSKAELADNITFVSEKDASTVVKVSSIESNIQLKGISKVVLSKPQQPTPAPNPVNKRVDAQKRKPRLVTTMPSSCIMPKLTQTEIRRRLTHLRFPIVILGKDQVCSNIEVMDYKYPQFNGLDKHIWPFMLEWSDKDFANKDIICPEEPKALSININRNKHVSLNPISEIIISKHKALKEKKTNLPNYDLTVNKKKPEIKPSPPSELKENISLKKQKSIVQLKDKMLNFLYKKSSIRNVPNNDINQIRNRKCSPMKSKTAIIANKASLENIVDTTKTDTQVVPKKRIILTPVPNVKKPPNYVHPWAKGKWASDFIDNVIKKIRSGVYYTQDHKSVGRKYKYEFKEVSVQAGSLSDSSDYTQTYKSDTEYAAENFPDKFITIPGFDNTLPVLEITTLNVNQIAVKNCVTNIMVQFDVSIPVKCSQSTISLNKSLPLISLEETDSHMKIYKCKTTIVNAMLPAELCTILPKMINIIDSTTNSNISFSMCPTKTDSCLSTITELTRETPESISCLTSLLHIPPQVKRFFGGRFTNNTCYTSPKHLRSKVKITLDFNNDFIKVLLPILSFEKLALWNIRNLVPELIYKQERRSEIPSCESIQSVEVPDAINVEIPTCTTAIQTIRNKTLSTTFKTIDLMSIVKSIMSNQNLQISVNLASYSDLYNLQRDGKNIKINMSMTNDQGVQKNVSVTVSNLKIDSLYKALPKKSLLHSKSAPLKCIEYKNNTIAKKLENTEFNQVIGNKVKRKGFNRVYRKCKSATNISAGEKSPNTPLNKITTLDDFFQILGSKKMLCSVFDGYAAKKILSSIIEMKNWITEINPKQALLILLLTNKKDTPNLVRFRPILLQGIAVNRITRAAELDMEIEVIERENLNKFSQYEGISYLPESVTNYDNLLEELYWIAKTTASDYQRPFDESSERLLKSLLEKRKKLNPSYLRVMARYVGLGLLKSPTKN